ncbi:MAG: PEP-CTERM sorting domain-containing protein [Verrucomicrobia bacterium]|nr:PEP-CTERM sorting domain-containing protein [Verrucomicrobiota bacterium]
MAAARAGASFSLAQSGNNIMVSYVPEPGSASLLLVGLASLAVARASSRRANPV